MTLMSGKLTSHRGHPTPLPNPGVATPSTLSGMWIHNITVSDTEVQPSMVSCLLGETAPLEEQYYFSLPPLPILHQCQWQYLFGPYPMPIPTPWTYLPHDWEQVLVHSHGEVLPIPKYSSPMAIVSKPPKQCPEKSWIPQVASEWAESTQIPTQVQTDKIPSEHLAEPSYSKAISLRDNSGATAFDIGSLPPTNMAENLTISWSEDLKPCGELNKWLTG